MSSPLMPRRCGYCGHIPCRCAKPLVSLSPKLDIKELMSATVHCFRYDPTMPRHLGRICDCYRIESHGLCTCSCDGDACGCSCPGCLRARRVDIANDELILIITENAVVFRTKIEAKS